MRQLYVHIVLAFLLLPNLICLFLQMEIWPFSYYPMFSASPPFGVRGEYRLMGVREDGERVVFHDYSPNNMQFMARKHFPLLLQRPDGEERIRRLGLKLGRKYNETRPTENQIRSVEFCRVHHRMNENGQLQVNTPNISVLMKYEMD